MKNRLFLILVFGGILLSCSNPSSEEKKYIKTNKAEIKTDANEDGKYSVIPIDSLTLRYTFNSNIPTQFKITNSIYYLGNGNSIMGFNSKGGKDRKSDFQTRF